MTLYVDFEVQQYHGWCNEPWKCKIETLGPVWLEGLTGLTDESPEVLKCEDVGTRILQAMNDCLYVTQTEYAEVELSDEEFEDIKNADKKKARLKYIGKDEQGRERAILKYPTFGYL